MKMNETFGVSTRLLIEFNYRQKRKADKDKDTDEEHEKRNVVNVFINIQTYTEEMRVHYS